MSKINKRLKDFSVSLGKKIADAHSKREEVIEVPFFVQEGESLEDYYKYQNDYFQITSEVAKAYIQKIDKGQSIMAIDAMVIEDGLKLLIRYNEKFE